MNIWQVIEFVALFFGGFTLTFLLMPKIIGVAKYRRLTDAPISRSSHTVLTPRLGGIAFYIVVMISLYFLKKYDVSDVAYSITPALLILFIIGLKDDLTVLTALTKLISQIIAVGFILMNPAFQITELNGFLNIEEVNGWYTFPISAFIMIAIINAYNLIDGIDGLATTIGIIIFFMLGLMFNRLEMTFFFGISLVMIASLLAFLRFNLSSTHKKIFMGDTGSLIVGLIIAFSVIRLFAVPQSILKTLPFQLENLPLIVLAILVVPFFDTARVFTIRIINKKGPFSPDRNHIHHLLIDYLKLSHRRASFFVGVFNFTFIVIFVFLGTVIGNWKLLLIFITFAIIFVYFFYRIDFSYKNLRRRIKMRKRLQKITSTKK